MNSTKNLAIGVLSTTAVILLVGLILLHSKPEPAYGGGMTAQGGDYLLVTGQIQRNEQALYVIDAGAHRMIAYRFDLARKQIKIISGLDLNKIGGGDDDSSGKRRSGRGRRGGR